MNPGSEVETREPSAGSLNAPASMDREKALILAAVAARAWATRGTPEGAGGPEVLRHLMEASSWIGRSRRNAGLDTFPISALLEGLDTSVSAWLPGAADVLLIEDGRPTPICLDLAEDAGSSALPEVEQRVILQAMDNIAGRNDAPEAYTGFRRFLVEHAHATRSEAARAVRAVGLELSDLYGPIPPHTQCEAQTESVFYPCPRCAWPMAIQGDRVSCERSVSCLASGARFLQRSGELIPLGPLAAPSGVPVAASAALRPGVWRYTVLPGLEELDLAARLGRVPEVNVVLWPHVDRYDLDVVRGEHHWRVDVKDHVSAARLARHLSEQTTREVTWIVVPDSRRDQVFYLRHQVPPETGYRFASSSEFVRQVRGTA